MCSHEDAELMKRAANADSEAISELIEKVRDRLVAVVQWRMDSQLRSRVDASDVVQEATIEAARRLPEYAKAPAMDLYLWMRSLTMDKLIDAYRHHVEIQKRSSQREVSLEQQRMADATSSCLAVQLVGQLTTPTQAAERAESQLAIQKALAQLDPVDREILIMRHFENLSNDHVAQVLGIKKSGASRRYIMALKRIQSLIVPPSNAEA